MTDNTGLRLYRVCWEIEVEADTPREAAEKVRLCQREPGTTATGEVATVHPYAVNRYGRPVTIDLMPE